MQHSDVLPNTLLIREEALASGEFGRLNGQRLRNVAIHVTRAMQNQSKKISTLEPFLQLDIPELTFDGGKRFVVPDLDTTADKRRVGTVLVQNRPRARRNTDMCGDAFFAKKPFLSDVTREVADSAQK
jgi:hypothetical protein